MGFCEALPRLRLRFAWGKLRQRLKCLEFYAIVAAPNDRWLVEASSKRNGHSPMRLPKTGDNFVPIHIRCLLIFVMGEMRPVATEQRQQMYKILQSKRTTAQTAERHRRAAAAATFAHARLG